MARVRPHFKAHTSISHHRLMSEIYPNNDLLSLWLRLGIVAIDRYAAKADDRVRIHRNELSSLTGGKRRDKAEETLRLLATKLQLGFKKDGEYYEIQWRNLSKKQGFVSDNGGVIADPDTNADTDADANSYAMLDPESLLPPHFVEVLREIRPGGIMYSQEQVQNWFLHKRPQMKARGIKNFKKAAANWFERASRAEVAAAGRWVGVVRASEIKSKQSKADKMDDMDSFASMFESDGGDT